MRLVNRLLVFLGTIIVICSVTVVFLGDDVPPLNPFTQESSLVMDNAEALANSIPVEYSETQVDTAEDNSKPSEPFLGCDSINKIQIQKKAGSGYLKTVYLGIYRDRQVAVKIIQHNKNPSFAECIEGSTKNTVVASGFLSNHCSDIYKRFYKEILLIQELRHNNIIKLLGFCLRGGDTDIDPDIRRHDIAIYEYGQTFTWPEILKEPWETKLAYALQLADLVVYLKHSPIGSLRHDDLKPRQFVLINSTLKLVDIELVTALEPPCKDQPDMCEINVPCENNFCVGFNAMRNMKLLYKNFFKDLLNPTTWPESMKREIGEIHSSLGETSMTAETLHSRLSQLQS